MTDRDRKIIKDAEEQDIPIFVLIAKDRLSVKALSEYNLICLHEGCDQYHQRGIRERLSEFEQWQNANPDKVKKPD